MYDEINTWMDTYKYGRVVLILLQILEQVLHVSVVENIEGHKPRLQFAQDGGNCLNFFFA